MKSNAVTFFDENLTNNIRYAFDLLDGIKNFGKKYFVQVDPTSALNEKVAKKIGEAGAKVVLIGFESVNPENLTKYVSPSEWPRIIENFHKQGVMVDGNFMVGFDNDGPDIFEKTADAAKRCDMDYVATSVLTPYPGTKVYNRLKNEGRIFDNNWSNCDLRSVVYEPKLMTPDQLLEGSIYLKREFRAMMMNGRKIFLS